MKIIGIVAALFIMALIGGVILLEIGGVDVEQTQVTKEIPLAGEQG